ncbi:MAG: hypothetical protein ACMG6S_04970, partial [Byssovorax sp.]
MTIVLEVPEIGQWSSAWGKAWVKASSSSVKQALDRRARLGPARRAHPRQVSPGCRRLTRARSEREAPRRGASLRAHERSVDEV